eukprot:CAMPEP_0172549000 /NCGR_PEP_ID=MMETSP1067-20121228/18184_1 /TAXON_ID=265564 ORGANISM="Thalassiosira punctigera, Strain Tpunct2005C2" /NCGR_SAMPLE_ID=MMETSP1067 /ASSEMBLY_ACC=CAM_ASM_000444 /LENGTH=59 /DNA_ID=CAMNT_0013336311 /DNA_START=51 /DNA_END=227 /DNA_ORIENTATION=-
MVTPDSKSVNGQKVKLDTDAATTVMGLLEPVSAASVQWVGSDVGSESIRAVMDGSFFYL